MRRSITLFVYELKKLLISAKGWIPLLAVVLLQLVIGLTAKPHLYQYDFDAALYQQTLADYAGPCSDENAQHIRAALDAAQQRIVLYSSREQAPDTDLIEQARQLAFAREQEAVLNALSEKYTDLCLRKAFEPALTYDLELTDYLRRFPLNWPSLLCMLLLIPVIMLRDSALGMEQILFPSTAGQKQLICTKLAAAVTVSVVVTAVCSMLQIECFLLRWDFGTLTVPIQSITGFADCGLHCTVLGGILLTELIRLLAAAAAALLLSLCALLIRRETAAIAAFVIVLGGTAVLTEHSRYLIPFSLYRALSGLRLLEQSGSGMLVCILLFLIVKLLLLCAAAYYTGIRKH